MKPQGVGARRGTYIYIKNTDFEKMSIDYFRLINSDFFIPFTSRRDERFDIFILVSYPSILICRFEKIIIVDLRRGDIVRRKVRVKILKM